MTDASTENRGESPISLVALLGVVLMCELWLNRVAARLARVEPGLAGSLHRLDVVALFTFELASVLSTFLLGWALVRIVANRAERRALRLSFSMIGGVTAALAMGGVWLRLPIRLVVYLYMSTLFLLFVVLLGVVASPVLRRVRFGVVTLAIPVATMIVAELVQRYAPSGIVDPRASALRDLAGALFVLAGLLSPWLFRPSRPRGALASTFGAVVLATGLVLARIDSSLTARLADLGLGVAVPIATWGLPLYIFGAACFTYAIVALLSSAGVDRLRGLGLLVVCLIGLQIELPYQLASVLLGFFCLLDSVTRDAPAPLSRAELDAILRRVATVLGSAQVTVVGDPGRELARLGFDVAGKPGQVVIVRRSSAIAHVELSIGEIPERAPPLSIAVRGATSLGPAAPGPAIATDDAAFDGPFVVRDHRNTSTAILDAPTRARLLLLIDGWVGVWPQRGARFRSRALPADDNLAALATLLAELMQRAG